MSDSFTIHPLDEQNRDGANRLLIASWGTLRMVSRGVLHDLGEMPGFVALRAGDPVGVATYRLDGDACEITSLDSRVEEIGVGSALIEAVLAAARVAGCTRLWLITTNDNLYALGFYQRRGFHLVALYADALADARRLKPEIPLVGMNGIPLRDELELEIML